MDLEFRTVLEWSGTVLGLLGAFLLALNTRLSRWGWVAFLAANLCVAGFAKEIGANGLFTSQLGFTVSSLVGLFRSDFEFAKTLRASLAGQLTWRR